MRVRLEILEPKRTRRPTMPPISSPSVNAIRDAAARAASRRGSSTRIFLSSAQGSSSRTNGTRVVFPAPGGATRTAALLSRSAAVRCGKAESMGRGVSNVRIKSRCRPRENGDPYSAVSEYRSRVPLRSPGTPVILASAGRCLRRRSHGARRGPDGRRYGDRRGQAAASQILAARSRARGTAPIR